VIALLENTWHAPVRSRTTIDLLDVTELQGCEGAVSWLDARDLSWFIAQPASK